MRTDRITWEWTEEAAARIRRDMCPICGKPKHEWTRRRDWMMCSRECTDEFEKNKEKYLTTWWDIRQKVIHRDSGVCRNCGDNMSRLNDHGMLNNKGWVVDHIVPIAVGGSQTDLANLQLLCPKCNKIKTRNDLADIARHRIRKRTPVSTADDTASLFYTRRQSLLEEYRACGIDASTDKYGAK